MRTSPSPAPQGSRSGRSPASSGSASSALYRYYPSRDALLTQLIIEAYDELGDAVETHEATFDRADLAGRYAATCHAVRNWARAHPHEYALIYGSPVPGYAAPDDTIDPAVRVAQVFLRLAADIDPAGLALRVDGPIDSVLLDQFSALTDAMDLDIDADVLALGVTLWAQLFGIVSFELFGTFNNTFEPADAIFEHHMRLGAVALGLDRERATAARRTCRRRRVVAARSRTWPARRTGT